MGSLVDGVWTQDWLHTESTEGRFVRQESSFRDWIRADGSTPYVPEAGRYHLYVSHACPWAHRTMIVRKLKKLEDVISASVVEAFMGENGWSFGPDGTPDPVHESKYLHELYTRARPGYSGRVTVPLLWDRQTDTAVNNESSEIIRMLNAEFDTFGDPSLDLYPEALRAEIDAVNDRIYPNVNNGVYRCGFATTQVAYEEAFADLFGTLDEFDTRLRNQRYLVRDRITEADWRFFTTLVRFDAVYFGHFKCNLRRISDYANLSGYLRELYQIPGVSETVNLRHIKEHYYRSHETINPSRIVPKGPELDFESPHGRVRL